MKDLLKHLKHNISLIHESLIDSIKYVQLNTMKYNQYKTYNNLK